MGRHVGTMLTGGIVATTVVGCALPDRCVVRGPTLTGAGRRRRTRTARSSEVWNAVPGTVATAGTVRAPPSPGSRPCGVPRRRLRTFSATGSGRALLPALRDEVRSRECPMAPRGRPADGLASHRARTPKSQRGVRPGFEDSRSRRQRVRQKSPRRGSARVPRPGRRRGHTQRHAVCGSRRDHAAPARRSARAATPMSSTRPSGQNLRIGRPARRRRPVLAGRCAPRGWLTWSHPAGRAGHRCRRGRAARLSGGQRHGSGGAASATRRAILVLDEPTEHLDEATSDRLLVSLLGLAPRRTVVLITHAPVAWSRFHQVLELGSDAATASADHCGSLFVWSGTGGYGDRARRDHVPTDRDGARGEPGSPARSIRSITSSAHDSRTGPGWPIRRSHSAA